MCLQLNNSNSLRFPFVFQTQVPHLPLNCPLTPFNSQDPLPPPLLQLHSRPLSTSPKLPTSHLTPPALHSLSAWLSPGPPSPLLFHHLLQLEASQLHAPLALVVQDVRIRPLHQGSLQAPQFLLSLVVRPLTPAAPHQGQVALDVAVGAAAPGRRQPDPVVHGPVPGGGGTTAPEGERGDTGQAPGPKLTTHHHPNPCSSSILFQNVTPH